MTKIKTITTYTVLIIVSLMMMFGISRIENSLDKDVKEYHLRFTGEIKNAPAFITFTTVALGSFRGVLADILWLRQMALKDQGSYFEMVQLASWITKLQPQFAGSAVYLGWEMAYNLSVTCSNFEDRWRWIQEGIKLLRDEAMIYNPEDVDIYVDLAKLYFLKFGNVFDDAHLFYKNKLFMETSRVIGANPNWEAMAKVTPWFRLMDWNEEKSFFEKFPQNGSVWQEITTKTPYKSFPELLEAYTKADGIPASIDFLSKEDSEWMNYFLRACWIWNTFKLNPHRVADINKEYGNLDWRTPEAFAIYWAKLGIEFRPPNQTRRQLDNVIAISLQESFRHGRPLLTDPENMVYFIGVPNFSMLERTLKSAEEGYENNKDETFLLSRNYFLRDAIVLLYSYGQTSEAQRMFELLKETDVGMKDSTMTLKQFYDLNVYDMIEFATVKEIGELMVGTIYCALHYWVLGDQNRAMELEKSLNWMYNKYLEDNSVRVSGVELPPLEVLYAAVVDNFIKTAPPQLAKRLEQLIKVNAEQQKAREEEARKIEEAKSPLPGM